MTDRALLPAALLCFGLATPAVAQPFHGCWIERVTFTAEAAVVHFRENASVRAVVRTGEDGPVIAELEVSGIAPTLSVRPPELARVSGLHAGCTIAWQAVSGRDGVVIKAWSNESPNRRPQTFESFVPRP